MNLAHVHIIVNHIPVIGVPTATIVMLFALSKNSQDLARVALLLLLGLAVFGVAAFLTGEPASDVIKTVPDYSESIVERHEMFATITLITVAITAVVCLVVLVKSRGRLISRGAMNTTFLFMLLSSAILTWTAHLGGQVRHTESRPGWSPPPG